MEIEYHYRMELCAETKGDLYDAYMRRDYDEFYYNVVAVVVLARIDGDVV